jgi:nucleotide-binding universal stress UspA family protein
MVVPADAADAMRRIAVAFDGEAESRTALAVAADLAQQLGARLVLIAVAQAGSYGVPGAPTLTLEAERLARTRAQAACDEAIAALPDGVQASSQVVNGPAGHMIAEAARDADLLVAGSRAYGPVRSVLLGSTSGYLADHAACSVLVVPRAPAAAAGGPEAGALAAEA